MNKLLLLIAIAVVISACSPKTQQQTQAETKCPDKACTMMFASVPVSFVDAAGQPVIVKYYKAINLRTSEEITKPGSKSGSIFTVADDGDLKKLTEAGDSILVSASDSITNKNVMDTIVVSGGVCACHVARVSGKEQVVIK